MSARRPTPVLSAQRYPPRHTLHKYWGKKPANVVSDYVLRHAPRGGTVLDPFSGSGIVLSESLIARRRVIAADVNPIANLIARVTAEAVDPGAFMHAARDALAPLDDLRHTLYGTVCHACGGRAERVATAFDGDTPLRAAVDCLACGIHDQAVALADARPAADALPAPGEHPDAEVFRGWQMQKLVRRGVARWSELFTPRNLVAVAHIRRAVQSVTDDALRRALTVTFTAHLAQATRMIADYRGDAGGPSWKVNSYWLPNQWQELNPFRYFDNRVCKTARGLADMRAKLGRVVHPGVDYTLHTLSAEALPERVPAGSVDYVFTDPPYGGEGIQYGELSMLWNLWADSPVSLATEICHNPYQSKTHGDYARRLDSAFAAIHTLLAPESRMSVTFANKDATVWDALLTACRRAGFTLGSVVPLMPSAGNVTQRVTRTSPKSDLVVTFRKRAARASLVRAPRAVTVDRWIRDEAKVLGANGKAFRTSALHDRVLIRWITRTGTEPEEFTTPPKLTVTSVADYLSRSEDFMRVTADGEHSPDGTWTCLRSTACTAAAPAPCTADTEHP